MEHILKLQPKYFDYINNGTKRIELRLYDEKIQKINEFKINEDALTGNVTLVITDFADESDLEDAKILWEEQVRVLGLQLGIRL